ncbi:Phage-related protein [Lachnospiraceae bacterium TWA4]|nr:Phage-related protein [Lachnospiraceae bacterium TWA4]
MKQVENYVYPAIIKKLSSGEIEVDFIDFPGIYAYSSSDDINEIIKAAQEVLALTIVDYEADPKKKLPNPTSDVPNAIFIHIWMPYFKNIIKKKEVYVKKTLTIPEWLDILAKEKKINFSAILVKGLKEELGIE